MANQIVMAHRAAPWIGIGVSGNWETSAEALEAAQLDFEVMKEKTFWHKPVAGSLSGQVVVDDEQLPMYANVRADNNEVLGCVTPQYKIIQNKDAFSLIDPFISSNKGSAIIHAGMTMDGLCFMVAEITAKNIGGDDYYINLMVTNSFNTKYPCQVIMTPLRIICQNMYRKLVNDKVFLAKHTLSANERLLEMAQGDELDKRIAMFSGVIGTLQGRAIDMQKLEMLVAMLFPFPKEGSKRELAYKKKTEEQREMFLDVYYSAPDNTNHHGTAFGFVNAYYDWLSHRAETRNTGINWEDRRLGGLVSGNDINTNLIKQALK